MLGGNEPQGEVLRDVFEMERNRVVPVMFGESHPDLNPVNSSPASNSAKQIHARLIASVHSEKHHSLCSIKVHRYTHTAL